MGNADKDKLIRIYGVTLAEKGTRPYGHGTDKIKVDNKEVFVDYVDYFIDDLVALIKQQDLTKKIGEKLKWPL